MALRSTMLATWLSAIFDRFEALGLDAAALAAPLGPGRRSALAPLEQLEIGVVRRVWGQAVELSGDAELGLKVGAGLPLQALNVVGVMLQHSPSVRAALDALAGYQKLVSDSGGFVARSAPGALAFTYVPTTSNTPLHAAQVDSVCSGLVAFLRQCGLPTLAPDRVSLPGRAGHDAREYERFFGCPVVFGAEAARLVFADAWLDRPIPCADPALLAMARGYADALAEQQGRLDALSQSVRAQVSAHGFAHLAFSDVARSLGVSERTLQRRLAEARTSFREIVEDARMDEARHLLTRSEASLQDIADRLAYSNPSSLSRAVRKRFGLSPVALRESRSIDG